MKENKYLNNLNKQTLVPLLIITPFILWLLRYINLDFWYDELTTMVRCILVPLSKTTMSYHGPNNHVFFNLIANAYLKLFRISQNMLINKPYIIRLLPLLYTILTLVYVYATGKRFFNQTVGHIALIVLTTTIPYYNYTLQIRGYNLSILLLFILIYHTWSIEEKPTWKNALIILICGSLLIYTLPSNLYFILASALFYFSYGIIVAKKKKKVGNKQFLIAMLNIANIGVATLLYSPIMHTMLNDRYLKNASMFNPYVLTKVMPEMMFYFVSHRYLLLLLAIIGLLATLKHKKDNSDILKKVLFCTILFFAPSVFGFIRGDIIPYRVLVPLAPFFTLLISFLLYKAITSFKMSSRKTFLIVLSILCYCQITFAFNIQHINKRLLENIAIGRRQQNTFYNYMLTYYQPRKLLSSFRKHKYNPSIICVAYKGDQPAMAFYTKYFKIKCLGPNSFEWLMRTQKQLYVIAGPIDNFTNMISEEYPWFEYEKLNELVDYHNIYLLTRK